MRDKSPDRLENRFNGFLLELLKYRER